MRSSLALLALATASAVEIPLVTFDGAAGTTHSFKQLNDPVMGGQSSGSWSVENGVGIMRGEVVNVPKLKAPGFITAAANDKYPDASAALAGGLRLRVKSPSSDYTGFRVSFAAGTVAPDYSCAGGGSLPLSRGCWKAKFTVPAGEGFQDVYIPFNQFSDKWSPSTGEQTTTCADDADVCPTAKALASLQRMQVWAEGVNGEVELDVQRIDAVTKDQLAQAIPSVVQIPVLTFDGAKGTTFSFEQKNDPVMGGQSTGRWVVNDTATPPFGSMIGEVVNVPFLKAPGFIKATAEGRFADTSRALTGGLKLRLRSPSPDYKGFRLGFAAGDSTNYACGNGGSSPFSRGCFKRQFDVPASADFQDIYLPFNTFSDKWSPYTGDQTTTCAEDKDVCPTAEALQGVKRIEFWAEGVNGKIELDVVSIMAVADEETVVADKAAVEIPLVTFDGAAGTTHSFKQLNDPVMGGQSSGSWSVENGVGIMRGEVVNVPKLKAPGFITAAANDKYPDASAALAGGLRLRVKSPSSDYTGFRVSFAAGTVAPDYSCAGGGSLPLSRGCWKAKFTVPAGEGFQDVYIPFNQFSDKWSPSTGEQTTTCADDADVCPTAKALASLQRMQVWAEGVNGEVELDVQRIDAVTQ